MRPIHVCRTTFLGLLACFTVAGGAAAQTPPSAVLNSLEVQQLITRAEPTDHARLGVHFAALAERYATDAEKHSAMAQVFSGSPIRQTAANSAADHCKRLAELNTESAATLRELATHHNELAAGKASIVPRGAARFEGGAGAPPPTEHELNILAARASTPSEHAALQEYFQMLANRYMAEANEHAAMAHAYRGTRAAQSAAHCDRVVKLSRDSAKEATADAAMHKDLAGVAR